MDIIIEWLESDETINFLLLWLIWADLDCVSLFVCSGQGNGSKG